MSFGQSFGAFADGMNRGYTGGKGIIEARQRRQEKEQPAPVVTAPAQQSDADTSYEDQAWQMLRDMAVTQNQDDDSDLSPYAVSQPQQSNGMSINPSSIQQFMPSSGAGGLSGGGSSLALGGAGSGIGGSGLMGSAGGAMSAGANGGASFGLGGSLVGGTGTVGGSTFAASAGGGAAAGGAAGGGAAAGGSAAGGIASGGPWALLAAAIIGNETHARKKGRRNENKGKHALDLVTGKVLEQDADHYGDKVGGPLGKSMKFGGQMGNPEGVFKAVKKLFGG